MAGKAFKLNTSEWDKTFPVYMQHTKRDLATVMNTKGFYIARRATVETKKADLAKIKKELGRFVKIKGVKKKNLVLAAGRRGVPLAEAIVRSRIHEAGEKQPSASEISKTVRAFVASRIKSVAFIKSGWLAAIKKLAPLAEKKGVPKQDNSAKQFGKPKGLARAAVAGFRPTCLIQNDALPKRSTRSSVMRYAMPGLQRAFDFETKSMKDYIARKLAQSAQKLGIKATT